MTSNNNYINFNYTNAYQNPENIAVFQQQSQFIQPFAPSTTAEWQGIDLPLTHPQQISMTPMFYNSSAFAETQRQSYGVKRPATTEFGEGNKVPDLIRPAILIWGLRLLDQF